MKTSKASGIQVLEQGKFFALVSLFVTANSFAQDSSVALAAKLYQRLTGTPLVDASKRAQMVQKIDQNDIRGAADIAINEADFIDITVKQFLTPFSNVDRLPDAVLNDLVATGAGIVRDDLDFRRALYDDIYYRGNATLSANTTAAAIRISAWAPNNNNHYRDFATKGYKLSDVNQLVSIKQSELPGFTLNAKPNATSGMLTTRTSGEAFIQAGTNRRMFKFTLLNYMCREMENIHDTTQPDYMVRRDVLRDPSGDSRVFKAKCAGCHAIQDSATPAYAYYDFTNGALTYTEGTVVDKFIVRDDPKLCIPSVTGNTLSKVVNPVDGSNSFCDVNGNNTRDAATDRFVDARVNFDKGYMVKNDKWVNHMVGAVNKKMVWNDVVLPDGSKQSALSGAGMKSLHMAFANSNAFSECMAERVYAKLCIIPKNKAIQDEITKISGEFRQNQYKMKFLFARVAEACVKAEAEAMK